MPGKIIALPIREVIGHNWKGHREYFTGPHNWLDRAHTYILVFNPDQHKIMQFLLSHPEVVVLHKSKPAVNFNHPYSGPRNTLVVFELKEKENV